MSLSILVMGESGSGKTTSLRNLNPKETFIINVLGKALPFRGWKNNYKQVFKDKSSETDILKSNLYCTDDSSAILRVLDKISTSMKNIKTIIIDDFQYTMANEFMNRIAESGWDKFSEIGHNAWSIIKKSNNLRDDLIICILTHSEIDANGKTKCKTIGKVLDEKVCLEGMCYITFNAFSDNGKYKFLTRNNGNNIARSPMGMFEEHIDNDLNAIIKGINKYHNEDVPH